MLTSENSAPGLLWKVTIDLINRRAANIIPGLVCMVGDIDWIVRR
jgi:hypothetical protein